MKWELMCITHVIQLWWQIDRLWCNNNGVASHIILINTLLDADILWLDILQLTILTYIILF